MTTTILAVIALSGPLAPAAKPEFQAKTDYSQAMKLAASEKKPMAVLIGKGDQFAKMMADPKLTAEAKKLLTEKYVCLTVDVGTDAGKALAGQLQMAEGGLVISSAGGSYQAFRQAGTVTAADLSKQAATYAAVATVPTTTVTAGAPVTTTSYYPSTPSYSYPSYSSCPGGNCPNSVIPASGYGLPSTPFYGSSCPNGRCPNASPFIR
jgi:hypothetical protein